MGLRLGLLLFSILFLLGFIVLSFIHYSNKYKVSYKMRNMFPYELNYNSLFLDNGAGNFSMILMTASLAGFFATFFIGYDIPLLTPIMVIGIITSLIIPFVILTPLAKLKSHIAVFIVEIGLSAVLPAVIGVTALNIYQKFDGGIPAMITVIFSFLLVVFILFLGLNPKLSLQIKMDKKINANGSEEYVRPKFIPMAFTEWLLLLTIFIDAILVFILMLGM